MLHLGLANYYQRFVKGYSKIAAPLTELLKKDKAWDWGPKCQSAFDEIKLAMTSEPVLVLPDHTKPFEVFTDASDVAIGGVLMQEGHPVAYESRKLNETERRYTVHEKEMTAVARWQEFLAEFDLSLEHKPGKVNSVADALSRRCDMEFVSLPTGQMRERIKEGLSHDPIAPSLIELAKEGKTRKECHDSKWAGHPGIHRTLALIAEHYYWPHMGNDVEAYPLPIPEKPWESLSMDFIVGLPVSDGFSSIMVVVDRFSKYGTFIPASKVCPAEEAARLFLKYVVKYWGVPKTIISDRDTRFTGRFWKELFKLMGSILNFSTSVHPQTNGQTERVNALVETYLRHYVSATQRDWPKLLDVAQFSYNLQSSEATNQSSFEIVTGQQPFTPNTVGDLVLAKLSGILRNPYHKGLVRRYEGPFKVLKWVGTMAYKLELPLTIKAHLVFHVSLLKPYHQDEEELDRGKSHRAPVGWKGLPESEGSWEPFEALWQFRDKIDQFHSSSATRASLELVGENVTDRQPKTEPSSFKDARDYLCHVLGLLEDPAELAHPPWREKRHDNYLKLS
ncbi:hypothetical protein F3Y22_tig00111689pilonHSYRG00081 [Hibiscus syriacus]|uniref:Integrase catalytic domain-containing protein n=1 Tax=Hibiscus syriacus TaxID=106335 RepID=A0A6A2XY68_HIBSY|nr:hypothetical protein F3Y22_tig00111689pilonHSYRG00081 [Hibiscus syriacus]